MGACRWREGWLGRSGTPGIELNPCKSRVPVIDDDEMTRRVVSDIPEPRGCPILLAESGREALGLLKEGQKEISLALLFLKKPFTVPYLMNKIECLLF